MFPRLNSGFSQDAFIFINLCSVTRAQKNKENTPGYVHAFYKCHLEFSSVQNQSAFLILILIFVPDCRETQKYVYVEIWYSFGHRNNTFESLFRTNSIYGTGILSLLSRSSSKTVQCHSFFCTKLCGFWGLGLLFLLFIIQYSSVSCSKRFEAVPLSG